MSRLESYERAHLIRQTILFTGLSVALGLAFIFLILPFYIKILAARNLSSKLSFSGVSVPPSRPFLSQPFEATHSATITLQGSSQAGLKVILLHNGVPTEETTPENDGTFTFDVSLERGENRFSAVAENDKQERSNPSSEFVIVYTTDAPKLDVTEPADNATITQQKQNPLTVRGSTNPGTRVFINDQMLFVASDGSFTGSVQLSQGENKIAVKAVNRAGIETIKELTVRFLP